jgi:hypothetical protein
VPQKYKDSRELAAWITIQRSCFKTGKMDPGRKMRLDEIGFVFDLLQENWNVQFDSLRQFKNDNGHCELFWAVDRFTFILNTPLTLPSVYLRELQAM